MREPGPLAASLTSGGLWASPFPSLDLTVLGIGFRDPLLLAVNVRIREASELTEMDTLFCTSQVPGSLPHLGSFRGFVFSVCKVRPEGAPGAAWSTTRATPRGRGPHSFAEGASFFDGGDE